MYLTYKYKITFCLLLLYSIWGSTYIAIEEGLKEMEPLFFSSLRFLLGALILFILSLIKKEKFPTKEEFFNAAIMGILLISLGNGLITIGQSFHVSSGMAAILVATLPIFSISVGFVSKTHISRSEWICAGIGFFGIFLLNIENISLEHLMGPILILFSSFFCAVATIFGKKRRMPKGLLNVAIQLLISGIVLFILSLFFNEKMNLNLSVKSYAAIFYLAIFGAVIGFLAFNFLTKKTSVLLSTSYAYVTPIVAITLGIILNNDHYTLLQWSGMGIIICSVIIYTFFNIKKSSM